MRAAVTLVSAAGILAPPALFRFAPRARRQDATRHERAVSTKEALDSAGNGASFDQQDLIERTVAEVSYGLYASARYLKNRGSPNFTEGCVGHVVVSLVDSPIKIVPIEWMRSLAPLARVLGDRRVKLVRIEPPLPEPRQAVKLGVHAEMRDAPRIRALIAFLVVELQALSAQLCPSTDVRSRPDENRPEQQRRG